MVMLHPGLIAFVAAALFGASVPLANLLLGLAGQGEAPLSDLPLSSMFLAGLLYLGAGLGLLLLRMVMVAAGLESRIVELPPRSKLPALAGAVLCGGLLAPVLLLWGLPGTGSAAASLLLNTEAVFTAWLAMQFFGEQVGRRVWLAMLMMLVAGAVLAWMPGEWQLPWHALAILAACLLWGLDNNLTRVVAISDAITIALVKGLAAGSVNLALALLNGAVLPVPSVIAAALLLGAFAYGASLALYVLALRQLGSARTGAWFAAAPFCGVLLALAMGEPATGQLMLALVLMALAATMLATERHSHRHVHEPQRHAHAHVHDGSDIHHGHQHADSVPGSPHVHMHEHGVIEHAHEHLPDAHHRHRHHGDDHN
jgi:drug/metabolite transporter (DMT)-like permease